MYLPSLLFRWSKRWSSFARVRRGGEEWSETRGGGLLALEGTAEGGLKKEAFQPVLANSFCGLWPCSICSPRKTYHHTKWYDSVCRRIGGHIYVDWACASRKVVGQTRQPYEYRSPHSTISAHAAGSSLPLFARLEEGWRSGALNTGAQQDERRGKWIEQTEHSVCIVVNFTAERTPTGA